MDQYYDVVIVGSGPGGLTAGLYCARANLKTLLFSGISSVSQITLTDVVENYPGFPQGITGEELVERVQIQATRFGLEIQRRDVTNITETLIADHPAWAITAGEDTYLTWALIMATGAQWRKLNIPGEDTFVGRGVSYCATCDAPFYRDQEVAVIGGGDTAVQEALFLTQFARRVYLIHRRHRLRATGILRKRIQNHPQVEILWDSLAEEIIGNHGEVEGVRVRHLPSGTTRIIAVQGVFIFIGLDPQSHLVHTLVDLSPTGAIITDRDMKTSRAGIFAAGDCTEKTLRQVITACGEGAQAAYSAQLYVEELMGDAYLP